MEDIAEVDERINPLIPSACGTDKARLIERMGILSKA